MDGTGHDTVPLLLPATSSVTTDQTHLVDVQYVLLQYHPSPKVVGVECVER